MIEITPFNVKGPGAGGVNEKFAGQLIQDNQSTAPDSATLPLKNCHTDETGSIVMRKGYTEYIEGPIVIGATTLNKVNGIYEYKTFGGTRYQIALESDGTNQKIGDISTPSSITDITGSVN